MKWLTISSRYVVCVYLILQYINSKARHSVNAIDINKKEWVANHAMTLEDGGSNSNTHTEDGVLLHHNRRRTVMGKSNGTRAVPGAKRALRQPWRQIHAPVIEFSFICTCVI